MKVWAKTDGDVREGKYLVVRRDGTIPRWPHFVIGGDDYAGPAGLRGYATEAGRLGYDPEYCDSIMELADDFTRRAVDAASLASQLGTKGAEPPGDVARAFDTTAGIPARARRAANWARIQAE